MVQAPRLGGLLSSGEDYIVRPWLPGPGARCHQSQITPKGVYQMAAARQAAGEVWATHAEKSLGDDETPGSRSSGWSLRQRAKLLPASPEREEKMLVECDPVRDGPYRRHEAQGRTWADDCPGPAILPAPAADQR